MFANYKEENKLFKSGYKLIGGIDEVGRGSLAGPVTLGIVILNKDSFDKIKKLKLRDSKHLTVKNREKFYKIIKKFAIETKISNISNKIIDKININNAINLGLEKMIDNLKIKPEFLLLDGGLKYKTKNLKQKTKNLKIKQKTIIKGDEKCFIIACASIVAKVYRDNLMRRLAKKYPQYKFEKHKGYGTKLHFRMIRKYGLSKIHRKMFLRKFN